MVDLLQETIDDQALEYTNVTEDDPVVTSSSSTCCQDSCPEPAAVTIENNTFSIDEGEVKYFWDVFSNVTGASQALTHTPISGHDVNCFFDGALQDQGTDFTISGDTLTPTVAFANTDIKIGYWYKVA